MPASRLPRRLKVCADLTYGARVLADIGTDHAYLAIYLVERGLISRAVCTDVNEGPLLRAINNVESSGLSRLVDFRLTDGARELADCGADTYAVCGMGGELIADIISHAPHLMNENITLVLQPMSRPEALRTCLFALGFDIEREECVSDAGKHYVAMRARYSGRVRQASEGEIYFGNLDGKDLTAPDTAAYYRARLASLVRARDGIISGGGDASREVALIAHLESYLKK